MNNIFPKKDDGFNQFNALTNTHLIFRSQGKLLDLPSPSVMGILNITPDSYIRESRIQDEYKLLTKAESMLEHGAVILDIGAASSRPGSTPPDLKTEVARAQWAVGTLHKAFPNAILSIDTWRASVAEIALQEGAHIVNDISGGALDPNLPFLVARLKVPYIWMHMRGTPQNMQNLTEYDDIIAEMLDYFLERKNKFHNIGIVDQIIDPGFGFSKTLGQNYTILKSLSTFCMLRLPLLIGISRKSMITRLLDISPEEALPATAALHMVALQQGASLLRVHDVKEATQVIRLFQQLGIGK